MAKFCGQCGAPLGQGSFCIKCGADMRNADGPPQAQSPSPVVQMPQPPAAASSAAPAPAAKGMSTLAKLAIAAVVVVVGVVAAGAVGVYYVAHRVSQKVHQAMDGVTGSGSAADGSNSNAGGAGTSGSNSAASGMGDLCRLLSKEDVSHAIGVEIVRTHAAENGCSYIAKGTQEDMTAKHVTAMMAARGADKQTQQMIQSVAGGMGKVFASEKPRAEQDTSGEVPVFNFSVDQNAAEAQMQLNARTLGVIGDTQRLPGIGDEAFMSADGIIMVRKGRNLVRIMYITCPCGTDAVKPLAKMLADRL